MGLRIGTNIGALTALRNLRLADSRLVKNFEALSTGFRINRASDDPSGLVLSEQLRSQISAIGQAIENTQFASNLVRTADAAFSEISDIVVNLKRNVIASLNSPGPKQAQALQQSINQSVAAIDRIAATTRFGDLGLLNGTLGFNIQNASPELTNIDVNTVNALGGFPQTINIDVTAAATQGQVTGTIAAAPQVGAATFNISGNIGTQQITIQDGATQQQVIDAINAQTASTGVEATAAAEIRSVNVGSDQFARVEFTTGNLDGITESLTFGTDIQATVNGSAVTGQGNTISVQDGILSGQFTVQQGFTGAVSFDIEGGGARFQTGTGVTDAIQVGFPAVGATTLGGSSLLGALNSITTGGANSLQNNPTNALNIIGAALDEISGQRSRLGSIDAQALNANRNALGVQLENLLASNSRIRDLDFAEGISNLTKNQIIFESALQALRLTNTNANRVLSLLA